MLKLLSLILLFINTLYSNVILEENIDKKANFVLEKFYDNSKQLTIKDIQNKSFVKISSQFTFGHKEGNLWFKITVQNKSTTDKFILYFTEPYFHELSLYRNKNNQWEKEENGLIKSLDKRENFNHNPIFDLYIKPNETKTYYIQANSKLTTSGEFLIYENKYFHSIHGYKDDILYMFYFGAIFIITLINLFIYFRIKEKLYLYYSGYTFFYILWVASYCGLILHTPINNYFYKFLMVTPMFIMFLILFSSEFLNVKNYLPKIYKPLNIFGYTFGILAILIVISFNPWFEVMNALASVLFLVLFSVAIYILRKNNDINTKYYLFAMGIYMIAMSLMSSMANGWIENNDINRYSFLFASFFEIVFFALVLTNKFYIFQNEKVAMQKKLIKIQNKNEALLEKEIEVRTQEIQDAYIEVKNLSEERELLLKEVYHRVKNNFHMVIGMLWLENKKEPNNTHQFDKLINRIKSMSMIHEQLYTSKDLNNINVKEYLHKIINNISTSFDKINLESKIDNIDIEFDHGVSLGIIINEIFTNAIKYNSNVADLCIKIVVTKKDDTVYLSVEDNGIGFEYNPQEKGLGLKLVEQFCAKLPDHKSKFSFDSGTKFELEYKIGN